MITDKGPQERGRGDSTSSSVNRRNSIQYYPREDSSLGRELAITEVYRSDYYLAGRKRQSIFEAIPPSQRLASASAYKLEQTKKSCGAALSLRFFIGGEIVTVLKIGRIKVSSHWRCLQITNFYNKLGTAQVVSARRARVLQVKFDILKSHAFEKF